MHLLSVDSTAKTASVAIMRDGALLGEFFLHTGFTHSQTLLPMIDSLLSQCKLSVSDIDYCAISAGPGSFTGVRIGVCAIKGIAMPFNIPVVSVSTLEAMAYQNLGKIGIVCAAMDARREQVYNALFKVSNGSVTRLCEDRAISVSDLAKELSNITEPIFFVGDGALLCYNSCAISNAVLVDEHLRYQKATGVAIAAMKKIDTDDILSVDELMATYLSLSQAERESAESNSTKQQ